MPAGISNFQATIISARMTKDWCFKRHSIRRYEMSEDLLRQLQWLEEDYLGQPLVVQQEDLWEINHIRSQLGMPLVDARLNEMGAAAVEAGAQPEPKAMRDHTEAREIYQAWLKKMAELEVHRAYAE